MKTFGGDSRKIFFGLFFVFAAGFVIISPSASLGGIGVWNLMFTIFSMALLIDGIAKFSPFKILISLAFLGIIYAEQLGIEQITPWPILFAAVLLSIGLSIIFGRRRPWFTFYTGGRNFYQDNNNYQHEYTAEHHDSSDNSDDVNCSVSFGKSNKYLQSGNLKSAYLSCNFGELNVYFENAALNSSGAKVTADCSFGEISLYIPRGWNVQNNIHTSIGSVGDVEEANHHNRNTTGPDLKLVGNVHFGNVKIIYV